MFCINCFYPSTSVTNSRPSKKEPSIWRRRFCTNCKQTFTTHERPSLANREIHLPDGAKEPFNIGKLTLSISKAFSHSQKDAEYNSFWLARTVENLLVTQREIINPEDIEAATHNVLKRFDELAALQYAAQHKLISSVRRRGRPSLA